MSGVATVTVVLLLLVACASALSTRLQVPYAILLVIGGSVVGFLPGVPRFALPPQVVLSVLLPPLLYDAARSTSLRDLRRNARVISLAAVGLVLATTCVVAWVVHAAVDGLPWAAAFALGAIVSPTDPLAASQIGRRLGLPRRLTTIVEGEALVNDGSALTIYQSAVAAAGGGAFVLWRAGGLFVLEVLGGVAVGLVVGMAVDWLFRHAGPDQLLRLVLSLACGYLAYLSADSLGVSGVLAAVTAGVISGRRAPVTDTATSRLRNGAFWQVLVFLLNAVLFAGVGLQLPTVLAQQDRPAGQLVVLGLLVSAATILTRFGWGSVVTVVIRALDRRPSQRERRASWQVRAVNGWCGLRGAVSLAAALALPTDFPQRNLLVFLALCVIWATLVGQGLTLPLVIRVLRVQDDGTGDHEELHARKAATGAAMRRIDELAAEDWTRDDTMERLHGMYRFRMARLAQRAGHAQDGAQDAESRSRDYQHIVREVLAAQRRELVRLRDVGEIGDEALVVVERELDLEEERLDVREDG